MTTATVSPSRAAAAMSVRQRQQLLFLYLTHPNPSARVVGWSLFDGASDAERMSGDADEPPYDSALAAMRDGWRVFQVSQQHPPRLGEEHRTSYLPFEFVLERIVDLDPVSSEEPAHG